MLTAMGFGKLLSKVVVDTAMGEGVSVIATKAMEQLHLQAGSEVIVKFNKIMLSAG